MTLTVYSARIDYPGPHRLDVTRKRADTGDRFAEAFAPSWGILKPALDARRRADAVMAECKRLVEAEGQSVVPTFDPFAYQREAEDIEEEAWRAYVPAYLAEMRRSYRARADVWAAVLAAPVVVLCCYCTDAQHCHRAILRARILPALGAVDGGELRLGAPASCERCGISTLGRRCGYCAGELSGGGWGLRGKIPC